jgi:hypothetical protein
MMPDLIVLDVRLTTSHLEAVAVIASLTRADYVLAGR